MHAPRLCAGSKKREKLSSEAIEGLTQGMTSSLMDTLKSLGRRKPDQKGLREHITRSLESPPIAESRSALESKAGK